MNIPETKGRYCSILALGSGAATLAKTRWQTGQRNNILVSTISYPMGGTMVSAAMTLITSIIIVGSVGSKDLARSISPSSSSKINFNPYCVKKKYERRPE